MLEVDLYYAMPVGLFEPPKEWKDIKDEAGRIARGEKTEKTEKSDRNPLEVRASMSFGDLLKEYGW